MSLTKNPNVLKWVEEMVALCKPDKVVWIDGSKEQIDALTEEVTSLPDDSWDKMYKLNPEKYPNCLYHRTRANDVARVEDRTFICSEKKEDAGPTNNWMAPADMKAMLTPMYDGVMKGRTMYVIPYSMGPIGSPLAKVGVELTDSIYVVLNMDIMTRMGEKAFENLGDTSDDFVRGLHSKADVDPEKRYIVQFPEENTIWSINSAYGGNVLLGKKCFALRIASYQGKNEAWMAEHMLILGLKKPDGEVKYITAAFPSACGKTNLAMLIPPEGYKKDGYEIFTVGDDIAWMKPGKDGRLYAINPENGFFGVAPGTNKKSNPNALASTRQGTIFTNVVHNLDDNTVGKLIAGTDGLANNQTGNMVYADGKVYAVDQRRGLLVIDAAEGKLLKTVNNEGEGSYNSIVQAKDGSIWLTCSKSTKAVAHIVKFNPSDYSTETVNLPEGVYPPTNSWGAWNPDCFTASTTENALFWNGATGDWSNGQHIYKFDIDSRQTSLLLDFTAAEEKPYVYGAACRMNPYSGDLYLSVTKGSAWGDESELRVYSTTDATMKASYPMEKHYWFPEMPVFSLKSSATAITSTQTTANRYEVARYTIDGRLINQPQQGLNIVKYSDGTVKKVVVK